MANDSAVSPLTARWQSFKDWLAEQEWAQEIKTKWEELDAETRTYLKMGAAAGGVLLVLGTFLGLGLKNRSLKSELREKQKLLTFLQESNDELRKLKEVIPPQGSSEANSGTAGGQAWQPFFDLQAAQAGIDRAAISYSNEKLGPSGLFAKETQFDITLSHVNLKQVVRFSYGLENGGKPVKLRSLTIDTKGDPSGYLDASLQVSGFLLNSK